MRNRRIGHERTQGVRPVELRQLKHVVAVVETASLTRAAKLLFITQSAISHSLRNLEVAVGAQLFSRGPHGVVPTAIGQQVYVDALHILRRCAALSDNAKSLSQGRHGMLAIGITPLFAGCILDKALAELDGGFYIRIREGVSAELFQGLVNGTLDLVLSNVPLEGDVTGLATERLGIVFTTVIAAADHPVLRRRGPKPADFTQTNWAFLNYANVSGWAKGFLLSNGFPEPAIEVETNSTHMLRTLVLRRRYLTIVPPALFRDELAEGTAKTLIAPSESFQRPIGMTYRTPASPKLGMILDALRKHVDDGEVQQTEPALRLSRR